MATTTTTGADAVAADLLGKAGPGLVFLEVGTRKFKTTLPTLTSERAQNSVIAAMFSGRHRHPVTDEGYVFLDRDGDLFAIILGWLRSGRVPDLSPDQKAALELEAEYFQLDNLLSDMGVIVWVKRAGKTFREAVKTRRPKLLPPVVNIDRAGREAMHAMTARIQELAASDVAPRTITNTTSLRYSSDAGFTVEKDETPNGPGNIPTAHALILSSTVAADVLRHEVSTLWPLGVIIVVNDGVAAEHAARVQRALEGPRGARVNYEQKIMPAFAAMNVGCQIADITIECLGHVLAVAIFGVTG